VKVIFKFGRILPATLLDLFPVRGSESKDHVTPAIGFDSGYRAPDREMFPQMVPRL
jgi:hypothetical protein